MGLTDKQIEQVFRLLKLGTGAQRQRFLGYLEGLRFNVHQQTYDAHRESCPPLWQDDHETSSNSPSPRYYGVR